MDSSVKHSLVILSGGFDPLHSGHIALIQSAKNMTPFKNDLLVVGLNSDDWLSRKKGRFFLPYLERSIILNNIRGIDMVFSFNDADNTAIDLILKVGRNYSKTHNIIFANGGDRTQENIPEMVEYPFPVEFKFGVGGENKKNSSSNLLEDWYQWRKNV